MAWRQRREIYMVLLGCAMLAVSIVVLVLNQNASTELLGAIGAAGSLAVILNAIWPTNGKNPENS
jgi:hypothetical protein